MTSSRCTCAPPARNGLTWDEIKEVLLQRAIYCGVPAANSAFAIAQRVHEEEGGVSAGGDPVGGAHADRPLRRGARRRPPRRPRGRRGRARRSSGPASTAAEIDDVYLGCANQAGEDNRNVARMAVLLAGLPAVGAGRDASTGCAPRGSRRSSSACHAVIAGDGDLFVAGGVESMTRAPLAMPKPRRGVRARRPHALRHDARLALPQPAPGGDVPARDRWARPARTSPSATASRARIRTRSRSRSQQRWAAAQAAGRFADELVVPVGRRRPRRAPAARHDARRGSRR